VTSLGAFTEEEVVLALLKLDKNLKKIQKNIFKFCKNFIEELSVRSSFSCCL
jgi:hypothetical protein